MKFVRTDLRKLQSSTLVAVLMLAVGATAVYVSYNARQTAEHAKLVVSAQRQEADGKLQQVRDEESEVKQKSIVFKQLQERGIIGDEQRLDWVELLKEIRDKHRLIDLHYEISPQRLLDGHSGDSFSFFASAMKVQLKLLHEEDLTRLLDELRRLDRGRQRRHHRPAGQQRARGPDDGRRHRRPVHPDRRLTRKENRPRSTSAGNGDGPYSASVTKSIRRSTSRGSAGSRSRQSRTRPRIHCHVAAMSARDA